MGSAGPRRGDACVALSDVHIAPASKKGEACLAPTWRIIDFDVVNQRKNLSLKIKSAAFSAIITTGKCVLAATMVGMIAASATRKPSTP